MTLLIGTEDGLWSDAGRLAFAGQTIVHLLADVSGAWVLLDGGELVRWEQGVESSRIQTHLDLNCVLVAGEGLWLGGAGARLYRLEGDSAHLWQPFEEVSGRSTWHTPWGGSPDVRSMAVATNGDLMVNVHVGGVVRAADAGAGWRSTMQIEADVHQVASGKGLDMVAAAWGFGWMVGDDWQFTTAGLHASYCRAAAASADWLFVSVSSGPGGGRSAVYRTNSPDLAFERCSYGLPEWFSSNIDTHCLAASGSSVYIGDPAGTVYRSDDQGGHWSVGSDELPAIRCLAVAK